MYVTVMDQEGSDQQSPCIMKQEQILEKKVLICYYFKFYCIHYFSKAQTWSLGVKNIHFPA